MTGELKSLQSLLRDGLASMSAVETKYGRQTKEFVSINNLMPVLKFSNYDFEDGFILNFKNVDCFSQHIEYLSKKENLKLIKTEIIKILEIEARYYREFIKNILD